MNKDEKIKVNIEIDDFGREVEVVRDGSSNCRFYNPVRGATVDPQKIIDIAKKEIDYMTPHGLVKTTKYAILYRGGGRQREQILNLIPLQERDASVLANGGYIDFLASLDKETRLEELKKIQSLQKSNVEIHMLGLQDRIRAAEAEKKNDELRAMVEELKAAQSTKKPIKE